MASLTPQISPDTLRAPAEEGVAPGCDEELQDDFSAKLNLSTQDFSQPEVQAVHRDTASQPAESGPSSLKRCTATQPSSGLPRHKRSVPKFLNELSVRSRTLKGSAEAGPKLGHASSESCLLGLLLHRHHNGSQSA